MVGNLRAIAHTRLRARDHCTLSTLIGGKGRAGPSSLYTMLEGTIGVSDSKMDVKSTWNPSSMASNVSWSLGLFFRSRLLEVGLTQNWETMALRNLTTVDLLYFVMCEDPTCRESHWNNSWLRTWSHLTSHYTWQPMITLCDFGSVLGWPLDTSFELPQCHGHNSWFVCEVALSVYTQYGKLLMT